MHPEFLENAQQYVRDIIRFRRQRLFIKIIVKLVHKQGADYLYMSRKTYFSLADDKIQGKVVYKSKIIIYFKNEMNTFIHLQ